MIIHAVNSYQIPFIPSQNYIVLEAGGIITNPQIYQNQELISKLH